MLFEGEAAFRGNAGLKYSIPFDRNGKILRTVNVAFFWFISPVKFDFRFYQLSLFRSCKAGSRKFQQ